MTSRSRAYLLYLFSRCRLIIITTIYTCPNPNPSPSLSTLSSYNTGSGTILFGNPACTFSLAVAAAAAGATDISVSARSYSSVEVFSLICKDPSRSDNTSISLALLEPVLSFRSLYYPCFVCRSALLHLSCKVSSLTLYQM